MQRPDILVHLDSYPEPTSVEDCLHGLDRRRSRQLAGLVGPVMVALGATEALNIDMFAGQIPPVVYLDGTILFVVGIALVRAHNRWSWSWPTLITITGWILLGGGLYRMIAPEAPQASANALAYGMFAVMIVVGLLLTYKGCAPNRRIGD